MKFLLVLLLNAIALLKCSQQEEMCVTGYMTELQSWVDVKGSLIVRNKNAIDLSGNLSPVTALQQQISRFKYDTSVKYLSMARCKLEKVPFIFSMADSNGRKISETMEYLSFYGNNFVDISSPGEVYDITMNASNAQETSRNFKRQENPTAIWSIGLRDSKLPNLKELDLRSCAIQVIGSNIFKGMTNLEALYIGENEILFIETGAFYGLKNLIHLDLSRNYAADEKGNNRVINTSPNEVLNELDNLQSLDLSFTAIHVMGLINKFGTKIRRLSLCYVGILNLPENAFTNTSLHILDVSGNHGVFSRPTILKGLEKNLRILYAKDIGLNTLDVIKGFDRLEVVDLAKNEITIVSPKIAVTLKSLQILNLDKNRLTVWNKSTFSLMPKLKLLSLIDNNINLISKELILDLANVTYLALSGNFIVCSCVSRDFFDLALKNEENNHNIILKSDENYPKDDKSAIIYYNIAFTEYNTKILKRQKLWKNSSDGVLNDELNGNFVLIDYNPSAYMCLMLPDSKSVEFSQVSSCNTTPRDIDYEKIVTQNWNKLYILILLPFLLVVMVFCYVFRRNFRYFVITMRNTAMLSLINNNEIIDDDTIFHYDVFVSYCHEDRNWVLDHLIPHLESDCSISACLHERDFQVGHSILENIVSCMDRSRSIMLIISQRFLLSKWCQFEMHLAQHRLLETRREDLTLVLLEEIPRRLRPNTLHYLMLTKTYIVWPDEQTERELFWKRLKKTIMSIKQKSLTAEKVSIA